jgi:hypothetical protein
MKKDTKFKPGQSGNPKGSVKGRKNTSWGKEMRSHPNVPKVINRIYKAALDDADDRQGTAWKLIMDRIAPQLKAEQVRIETDGKTPGVIILPEKKPVEIKVEHEEQAKPTAEA